jgi:predicted RNase H-like nuclease (RuvC/YqgF family)
MLSNVSFVTNEVVRVKRNKTKGFNIEEGNAKIISINNGDYTLQYVLSRRTITVNDQSFEPIVEFSKRNREPRNKNNKENDPPVVSRPRKKPKTKMTSSTSTIENQNKRIQQQNKHQTDDIERLQNENGKLKEEIAGKTNYSIQHTGLDNQ